MSKKKRKKSRAIAAQVAKTAELRDDALQNLNSFARQANDASAAATPVAQLPQGEGAQLGTSPSLGAAATLFGGGSCPATLGLPSLLPSAASSSLAALWASLSTSTTRSLTPPTAAVSLLPRDEGLAGRAVLATASVQAAIPVGNAADLPQQPAAGDLGTQPALPQPSRDGDNVRSTGPFGSIFAAQADTAETG